MSQGVLCLQSTARDASRLRQPPILRARPPLPPAAPQITWRLVPHLQREVSRRCPRWSPPDTMRIPWAWPALPGALPQYGSPGGLHGSHTHQNGVNAAPHHRLVAPGSPPAGIRLRLPMSRRRSCMPCLLSHLVGNVPGEGLSGAPPCDASTPSPWQISAGRSRLSIRSSSTAAPGLPRPRHPPPPASSVTRRRPGAPARPGSSSALRSQLGRLARSFTSLRAVLDARRLRPSPSQSFTSRLISAQYSWQSDPRPLPAERPRARHLLLAQISGGFNERVITPRNPCASKYPSRSPCRSSSISITDRLAYRGTREQRAPQELLAAARSGTCGTSGPRSVPCHQPPARGNKEPLTACSFVVVSVMSFTSGICPSEGTPNECPRRACCAHSLAGLAVPPSGAPGQGSTSPAAAGQQAGERPRRASTARSTTSARSSAVM
jgi:hypothetical protein